MSVSYNKNNVGRVERQQKELDPFDKLFRELGSFGNIGNNPDPFGAPPSIDKYENQSTTTSTSTSTQPVVTRDDRQPVQQDSFTGSTMAQPIESTPRPNISNTMVNDMMPVSTMSYGTGSNNLVAVSEPGPHHISMIYPSPEYGIIKLDKVIPNEVSADQPFKYMIVVTNLTDTMLPNVSVVETLSENFGFENADPMPQQRDGQIAWQIESLPPKGAEQITVFGRPKDINTLRKQHQADLLICDQFLYSRGQA